MNKRDDLMNTMFEKFENDWDIHEPNENHFDRFLEKQARKKTKKRFWLPLSIAATILITVGYFTFFNTNEKAGNDLILASKETKQTDSIFTAMIKIELEKVKAKKSPKNEKIIADALVQMEILDADYEKIKQDLIANGESKQIIYAMIKNLQTRISFLEIVLEHIEENENFNKMTDEKTV